MRGTEVTESVAVHPDPEEAATAAALLGLAVAVSGPSLASAVGGNRPCPEESGSGSGGPMKVRRRTMSVGACTADGPPTLPVRAGGMQVEVEEQVHLTGEDLTMEEAGWSAAADKANPDKQGVASSPVPEQEDIAQPDLTMEEAERTTHTASVLTMGMPVAGSMVEIGDPDTSGAVTDDPARSGKRSGWSSSRGLRPRWQICAPSSCLQSSCFSFSEPAVVLIWQSLTSEESRRGEEVLARRLEDTRRELGMVRREAAAADRVAHNEELELKLRAEAAVTNLSNCLRQEKATVDELRDQVQALQTDLQGARELLKQESDSRSSLEGAVKPVLQHFLIPPAEEAALVEQVGLIIGRSRQRSIHSCFTGVHQAFSEELQKLEAAAEAPAWRLAEQLLDLIDSSPSRRI